MASRLFRFALVPLRACSASRSLTALVALAALGLTAHPAQAQTTLSGSYNNQLNDGYDTTAGQSYIITPTATFNNNGANGVTVNSGSSVTVNGGQFSNNAYNGLQDNGGIVTVNGGTFSSEYGGVVVGNGTLNFYGGSVTHASSAVVAAGNSTVNIYGGTFSASSDDFYAIPEDLSHPTTITLYGTFSQYGLVPGSSGTFTGTLAEGGGLQTFTYSDAPSDGAGIFLVSAPAAVPEASTTVSFGLLLVLGLGSVVLARKKSVVA